MTGHSSHVQCCAAFQQRGGWRAISGSWGDTLKVWDLEAGSEVASIDTGHSINVYCCAVYQQRCPEEMRRENAPRILALLACGSSRHDGEFRSVAFRSVCRLRRATRLISEFAVEASPFLRP